MSLIGNKPSGLDALRNKIRNPFEADVNRPFKGQDFPDGFVIEELKGAKRKVRLVGNMMPQIPFNFGGEQRIKEDYYAGHSEPTTQVLGPKESDMTINGALRDKKYKDTQFDGVSTEIQEEIDAIRIRGNLCRFSLGEWERYGFIKQTDFNMSRLGFVEYSITLFISGFNAPTNAKFLQKRREIPFAINKQLIDAAFALEQARTSIPATVPQSISDVINGYIDDVAREIRKVTDLVDQAIETVADVQKSINRIQGLITTSINRLDQYMNFLASLNPFDPLASISKSTTARYTEASYFSSSLAGLSALTLLLNKYRDQFRSLFEDTPLGRHIVRQGDNLQKISNKFYGTSENWKEILEYNELNDTELVIGTILQIPRV